MDAAAGGTEAAAFGDAQANGIEATASMRELMTNLKRIATVSATEMLSIIRPNLTSGSTDTHLSKDNGYLIDDLVKEFVFIFTQHIESELNMDSSSFTPYNSSSSVPSHSASVQVNGSDYYDEPAAGNGFSSGLQHNNSVTSSDQSRLQDTGPSEQKIPSQTKSMKKPFYRRLSFKGFRKSRIFHRQFSDDLPHVTEKSRKEKNSKVAKIVVECSKEGIVHCISGESIDGDGSQRWDKCRLLLVKTAGGFMLEFYSPPKSLKPKSGVFCFLITEVRETTALEMPDRENTFVLKAENNIEYVIEASDGREMNSWLSLIKHSMRTLGPSSAERLESGMQNAETFSDPQTANIFAVSDITINSLSAPHSSSVHNPPLLPPRLVCLQRGVTEDEPGIRLSNADVSELGVISDVRPVADNSPVVQEDTVQPVRDVYSSLQEYPWFHGTLSRSEAARLVLRYYHRSPDGLDGHGTFLVRQSETRTGEFVLTFNFQGKAKHLRLTLSPEGQCRVQHLWFQSVFDMLEHFRLQPIPLESGGGTSDVTLTEFVVALPSLRGISQTGSDRSRSLAPELLTVMTHSGSVRTRSESMERLHREQTSGGINRAIENTYSFV